MTHRLASLAFLLVCVGSSFARADQTRRSPATPAVKPSEADPGASPAARTVTYANSDIVRVRTKVRYTTLIILPRDEVILDFVCGDKELWVIDGEQNFAYVKPAKENAETNLNLVTDKGNVYSFQLNEVSGNPRTAPDLKVVVQLNDAAMAEAAAGPRRFVSSHELDEYRQEAQRAKDDVKRAKETSEASADERVRRFLSNVRFAYRYEANKKPFYVRAIYHDDVRTYIEARPEETPTLYELRKGEKQPTLVNFTYENGVYVTDRILDSGYLIVGKQRLKFYREE